MYELVAEIDNFAVGFAAAVFVHEFVPLPIERRNGILADNERPIAVSVIFGADRLVRPISHYFARKQRDVFREVRNSK